MADTFQGMPDYILTISTKAIKNTYIGNKSISIRFKMSFIDPMREYFGLTSVNGTRFGNPRTRVRLRGYQSKKASFPSVSPQVGPGATVRILFSNSGEGLYLPGGIIVDYLDITRCTNQVEPVLA